MTTAGFFSYEEVYSGDMRRTVLSFEESESGYSKGYSIQRGTQIINVWKQTHWVIERATGSHLITGLRGPATLLKSGVISEAYVVRK